jgi:hypothetical protein
MDIDIEAVCWPGYDRPAMQNITVVAKAEDGRLLCTLECLRWAEPCFEITRADNLVAAFDEHSAFAYGLAEDVRKRRRAMTARHGEEPFVSGFIGIIVIRTEPDAVGNRFGLELIRYLKRMHAGMAWYAGLQAAPYDMEHGSAAYRDMRRRLTAYYASDRSLGFKEDAPRSSPGLMTALWDQE